MGQACFIVRDEISIDCNFLFLDNNTTWPIIVTFSVLLSSSSKFNFLNVNQVL